MDNILSSFDYRKAVETLKFLAHELGGEVDKLKIIKLIWAADRYHIRNYGRPVLGDAYYAMKRGPVASVTLDLADLSENYLDYDQLKYARENLDKAVDKVHPIKPTDLDYFSETDLEALHFSLNIFGRWSTYKLWKFSHRFPEWMRFKEQINCMPPASKRAEMSYLDFFKDGDVPEFNKYFETDPEILESAKEIFREDSEAAASLQC